MLRVVAIVWGVKCKRITNFGGFVEGLYFLIFCMS